MYREDEPGSVYGNVQPQTRPNLPPVFSRNTFSPVREKGPRKYDLNWKLADRDAIVGDNHPPERVITVVTDPFIGSPRVATLDPGNFMEFLKTKDAVLVFFFRPLDKDTGWLRQEIAAAACSTHRERHAYATVNCCKEKELCMANKADKTPRFNMYSRGHYVGSMREISSFKEPMMRQYVELSPLLTRPKEDIY